MPTTFVVAGQGNAKGVAADAGKDGVTLPGGVSINDSGVDLSAYPNGTSAFCGPLPYLVGYAQVAGASTVRILREATTANANTIGTQRDAISTIVGRLQGKGWTPDYWILASGEAETLNPGGSPAASYVDTLRHYVRLVLSHYPNCRVVIESLPMHTADYTGTGLSASYTVIEAAQRQVATEFPDRVLLADARAPTQATLAGDAISLTAGNGGGHDQMMARIRELWVLPNVELVQSLVWNAPDTVQLRSDTAWTGTLHVHPSASSAMSTLATDLQRILLASTGQAITRDATSSGRGILLGTYAQWGSLLPPQLTGQDHEFVAVTYGDKVLLLGRDDRATAFAAYRWLEIAGYAQLLPTSTWEVIPAYPKRLTSRLAVGETSPLDFLLALGDSGGIDEVAARGRLENWKLRNRVPQVEGGYQFGHAYGQIKNAFDEEFADHPEWIAGTEDGDGAGNKFCVEEELLQQLVVSWVLDEISDRPLGVVQKIAAADGTTGWTKTCRTGEQTRRSPTDRQLYLANYVQRHPLVEATGRRMSILGYGATSSAPTIEADPRVVVAVTDGYIEGGLTVEQVRDGYRAAGVVDTPLYVYTGLWTNNVGQPGQSRAARLDYMALDASRAIAFGETLSGLIAEGTAGFWPWGLGYWVLVKLCTDRSELSTTALRTRFLSLAFGAQAALMSPFYTILETIEPLSEDMLHRMYQILSDALAAGPTAAVAARIYDLVVYTRYCELLLIWTSNLSSTTDIDDFDRMVAWLWRGRNLDGLPVRLSYTFPSTWQPQYDRLAVKYPGKIFTWFGAKPTVSPWDKNDVAFTTTELDAIIVAGLANNDLLPFTPVGYSDDLVYVDTWALDPRGRDTYVYANRDHSAVLEMKPGQSIFTVTHIAGRAFDPDGPAYIRIYEMSSGDLVATVTALVDVQQTTHVQLRAETQYRIEVDTNSGILYTAPGFVLTYFSGFQRSAFQGDYAGYFLVPAGCSVIGGFASNAMRIKDEFGSATPLYTHGVTPGYFAVSITPQPYHRIMEFENGNQQVALMTVPRGFAFHPSELGIPRELAG